VDLHLEITQQITQLLTLVFTFMEQLVEMVEVPQLNLEQLAEELADQEDLVFGVHLYQHLILHLGVLQHQETMEILERLLDNQEMLEELQH
jgi:hypothetical protein